MKINEKRTTGDLPPANLRTVGRLHLITDTVVQTRYSHAELAALGIAGGVDTIQYRGKSTDFRVLLHEARLVGEVCRAAGVPFIVNDRVDLCLAAGADGVHLGLGDMPLPEARRILGAGKIIGATIRGADDLRHAVAGSADYAGLGPIFATTTKQVGIPPIGTQMIRQVRRLAPIPIIAIAGITLGNLTEVLEAGADGVAVIGAICAAQDVTAAARAFRLLLTRSGPKQL